MGGVNAGSITAALFLEEFVGGTPWAHVDIAGTAQQPTPTRTWRTKGASGFGAELLIELATDFAATGEERRRTERGDAPTHDRPTSAAGGSAAASSAGSSGSATRCRTRRSSSSA